MGREVPVGVLMQELVVLLVGGEVALQEGVVERVVVEVLVLLWLHLLLLPLLLPSALRSRLLLLAVINFHLL
jgi:hypothetical protein